MTELEKINKVYSEKFAHTFNAMDAAVVMAIAKTKDGKTRICLTTDIKPLEIKKLLKGIIDQIGG